MDRIDKLKKSWLNCNLFPIFSLFYALKSLNFTIRQFWYYIIIFELNTNDVIYFN